MIEKLIKLNNVGLFKQGLPGAPLEFSPVTLIYGENGRGKSTLASVMRACSTGEPGSLIARRTLDSNEEPEVSILVPSKSGHLQVEYKGGRWNYHISWIAVFDSEFVDKNVYSGLEVRPDQRQNLLEFALGDQAVELKKQVDQITMEMEGATKRRTEAEKTLSAYSIPLSVADFVASQPIPDIQEQIKALQRRREAARNEQALLSRSGPIGLSLISFDVEAAFVVLAKQLVDIEESAEAIVLAHLDSHHDAGIESWISEGQQYAIHEDCPFCGQPLAGVELIQAYRSFFDQGYSELKKEVQNLETIITNSLGVQVIESLKSTMATNSARIEAWQDQIELRIPVLNIDKISIDLEKVRDDLSSLTLQKQQQPLVVAGSDDARLRVRSSIETTNSSILAYNTEIASVSQSVASFKEALTGEDIHKLEAEIKKHEAIEKRQLPEVISLVEEFQHSASERKKLETKKYEVRAQIDKQMDATLKLYRKSLNRLLVDFGARFSIGELKQSYVGSGKPRTDYGLVVRDCPVKLGTRGDLSSCHSFGTTLSDGDRRTLAFSFFCARLEADPDIAVKTVIVDDPVSSLDSNRRYMTVKYLVKLASKCKQLIVLSHNAYFVRELRDKLASAKPTPIVASVAKLDRVNSDYSVFCGCNIDDVCASPYYQHYCMVWDFVEGESNASAGNTAKAIRPLIEGYYRRRFPGQVPRGTMLGRIIETIRKANPSSPIYNLTPLLDELTEVNEYARQFHHEVDSEPVVINDAELHRFAGRALVLIHENG